MEQWINGCITHISKNRGNDLSHLISHLEADDNKMATDVEEQGAAAMLYSEGVSCTLALT